MHLTYIVYLSMTPQILAHVLPRQEPSECCFSLQTMFGNYIEIFTSDESAVKQTDKGEPRESENLPKATFCLDPETKKLRDENGNGCFFTKHDHQFQCGPDGSDNTEFEFLLGPGVPGYRHLAYNGQRTFVSCEAPDSVAEDDDSRPDSIFYSKVKGSLDRGPSCRYYTLIQQDGNEACEASAPNYSESTVQERCEVMPDAQSITPTRVSFGPEEDLKISPLGHVVINETSSAIFTFDIDPNFTNHIQVQSRLCALQLRLPYCSSLPLGAACYEWSGRAQQKKNGSGVKVTKVSDTTDREDGFFAADLAQVTQEGIVWTSTFDCVADLSREPRTVAFMVESVGGWALRFQQAGVGESGSPQYESGIGAYITACNTAY